MSRRNILPYLSDIKPTDAHGAINMERLKNFRRTIRLERKKTAAELAHLKDALRLTRTSQKNADTPKQAGPAHAQQPQQAPRAQRETRQLKIHAGLEGHSFLPSREKILQELEQIETRDKKLALLQHLAGELKHEAAVSVHAGKKRRSLQFAKWHLPAFSLPSFSPLAMRAGIFAVMGLLLAGGIALSRQYLTNAQMSVQIQGMQAYAQMRKGIDSALDKNFSRAGEYFSVASEELARINSVFRIAGHSLAFIADTLAVPSQTASGVHVIDATEHFAHAGEALSAYAALFSKEGFGTLKPQEFITGYISGADLKRAKALLGDALTQLDAATKELSDIDESTLPQEFQHSIAMLKQYIPQTLGAARQFAAFQDSLFDVFGYLGPRKYLVAFQNSAELRATGGFIGSYALVELLDGKITKLFINDVFNIDGQLVDKVVPPFPVQKISTAWSLHDANWFFDYPTSAQKIAWFYEKTGGASVDGVISLTPKLLGKLLALAGPLQLPGYGIQLTQENFQDELSLLIEEGSPKKEGESPKVVLRDIGALLFETLQERLAAPGAGTAQAVAILQEALQQKDLLLWVHEPTIEQFIAKTGWGGAVAVPDGDYLAVVHSNINGYKTDRVVQEKISHNAEIASDGSVVDTVLITRTHPGSPDPRFDALYNKVNADYLRVYVPKGSKLLEASGYTPETVSPPINYGEANFTFDPQVQEIENSITVQEGGTHVFEESGKTVFGNWVYVSPGESVTVRYVYKLPWNVGANGPPEARPAQEGGKKSYTMFVQKQPGTFARFTGAVHMHDGSLIDGTIPQDVAFDKDLEYHVPVP